MREKNWSLSTHTSFFYNQEAFSGQTIHHYISKAATFMINLLSNLLQLTTYVPSSLA